MPIHFHNLPHEIQLKIFELATNAEHIPRVVEVFYKEGKLDSKQRPPALLHVCQLSRYIVLKIYKPWLPQFAGTLGHKFWETMVKKKGVERLSNLQNVCIDMDYDMLLVNSRICYPGMFGEIERQLLRNMAVEMQGWVDFTRIAKCARQCGGLKNLNLFEEKSGNGHNSFKSMRIHAVIERLAKKKLRKNELPYTIPRTFSETIEGLSPKQWRIEGWYRYEYPKGCKTPRQPSRLVDKCLVSEQHELDLEPEELLELQETSADQQRLGGCPRETETSATTTTKRKRYRLDAPQTSDANSRKSAKTSHSSGPRRHIPNPIAASLSPSSRSARQLKTPPRSVPFHGKQHTPSPETQARVFAENRYPNSSFDYSYFEDNALSPSPEPSSEPSDLPAYPPGATPTTTALPYHDPFHEWTELDWEPLLQPSSPPDQFIAPSIEQFVDLTPSPVQLAHIDPRNFWGALEDASWTLNDTADMDIRDMEDIDEEEEQRLLILQLQAEAGNEDLDEGDPDTSKTKRQGPMTPESDAPESTGVPALIRAERQLMEEVELLVQWKNYPDEKDWTWELESEFRKSAPKIVRAWRAKKSKEAMGNEAVLEDVVEKILTKRKQNGIPHYLVKWEGYEKIEDRTWEPCDRLKVDVPEIVEAYESKGKGKRRTKAKK